MAGVAEASGASWEWKSIHGLRGWSLSMAEDNQIQPKLRIKARVSFRCNKNQGPLGPAHTLHLDQELRFDPPGGLALIFISGSAEGIHLVDEDDGGLVLPGQLKQVLDQPVKVRKGVRTRRSHPCPPGLPALPSSHPSHREAQATVMPGLQKTWW